MRFTRVVVATVVISGATASLVSPAYAADNTVTTAAFQYVPPPVIAEGDGLIHSNRDIAPHDVVAVDTGPDGQPLFESAITPPGESRRVLGVESLEPGTYRFTCSLHGFMAGVLTVNDLGIRLPSLPPAPSAGDLPVAAVGGIVPTPTTLTVRDGSVFVASYTTGNVFALPILPGGLLGAGTIYAFGFSGPLGVEFGPDGTLFVADSHRSARSDRATAGRVWALPPGGGDAAEVGQIVVDELPNGRHNTNGMAVHEGRLYITNGNSTDDGVNGGEPEEPLSGTLISVDPAARGIVIPAPPAPLPPSVTVEAVGMRNDYDVAFRPGTDEAWITVNGPDTFDPYGEDTLVAGVVADGVVEDYGFPGCLYTADPDLPPVIQNPAVADTHPCGAHVAPKTLMGLHVSADGLAFGPEDSFWRGDIFVAEFGNFFGSNVVGHRVVRVPVDAEGNAGPPEDFFFGPAPLDVAFGPDGLYVADFASGQITLLRSPTP